jgi:hypothetical protein
MHEPDKPLFYDVPHGGHLSRELVEEALNDESLATHLDHIIEVMDDKRYSDKHHYIQCRATLAEFYANTFGLLPPEAEEMALICEAERRAERKRYDGEA